MRPKHYPAALACPLALALTATACSSSSAEDEQKAAQAKEVTMSQQWVKAVDHGATAVFGTLKNDSGRTVRLTSATTSASSMVMMHETVENGDGDITMREKKHGFSIKAHQSHEFRPGADHLMLMDVKKPIEPGADVSLTLVFSDGSRKKITVPARSYSGAKESYDPGQGDG